MMTDKNRKPAVYIVASIISYLAARIHNDLRVAAQLSKEAVSQWLKGEKVPRPAKLLQLSKLLGAEL